MKRHALLVTLVLAVVASACGGSSDTPPRTTVSLPDASSVSSDAAATREDVYKALSEVPDLPLQVVQQSADSTDTTSVFLADGSFEVRYDRTQAVPGVIGKVQVLDGSSSAAIVTADGDGSLRWISWSDVAETWREAVNNVVTEKYRAELTDRYSEGDLKTMRTARVKSTFAAVSAPLNADDELACMETEAKASQNGNGSWTLECERLAASVTVWLDDTGRVSRLDYKNTAFSTSNTATWGATPLPTRLEYISIMHSRASEQDIAALRRGFEQVAKATADELARVDKLASARSDG